MRASPYGHWFSYLSLSAPELLCRPVALVGFALIFCLLEGRPAVPEGLSKIGTRAKSLNNSLYASLVVVLEKSAKPSVDQEGKIRD